MNTIIHNILELFNKHGLISHQLMDLLERLGRIIEVGQRATKERRTRRYESLITSELVILRSVAKQKLVCMARPFEYHDT